jgi:hypothetical protein
VGANAINSMHAKRDANTKATRSLLRNAQPVAVGTNALGVPQYTTTAACHLAHERRCRHTHAGALCVGLYSAVTPHYRIRGFVPAGLICRTSTAPTAKCKPPVAVLLQLQLQACDSVAETEVTSRVWHRREV